MITDSSKSKQTSQALKKMSHRKKAQKKIDTSHRQLSEFYWFFCNSCCMQKENYIFFFLPGIGECQKP